MKQHPSCGCPTIFMLSPAFTGGWRPDDAVRLLRFLVRPALLALLAILVGIALLIGAQSIAPFVTGHGVTSPQFTMQSQERQRDNQMLEAEVDTFLASMPTPAPGSPHRVSDQP